VEGQARPPRTLRRIWVAGEIADVHKASGGTYGEMRVTAELRHGREILVSHNGPSDHAQDRPEGAADPEAAEGSADGAGHLS
jgi:hypothetical protein